MAGTELLCPLSELQTFQPQWLHLAISFELSRFFNGEAWCVQCCHQYVWGMGLTWQELLFFGILCSFRLGVFGVTLETSCRLAVTEPRFFERLWASWPSPTFGTETNFILQPKSQEKGWCGKVWSHVVSCLWDLQGGGLNLSIFLMQLAQHPSLHLARCDCLVAWPRLWTQMLILVKHQGSTALRVNKRSIMILSMDPSIQDEPDEHRIH